MLEAFDIMRQAAMTTETWLGNAKRYVDEVFSDYPPEARARVVAAYIQTAACDEIAMNIRGLMEAVESVPCAITDAAETQAEIQAEARKDAAKEIADSIRSAARHLGTGNAATSMGALECVAVEIKEFAAKLDILSGVKESIQEIEQTALAIHDAIKDQTE
jgi:hypothetical protein